MSLSVNGKLSDLTLAVSFATLVFVCFDSLRPINNLSVIKGRVFLG